MRLVEQQLRNLGEALLVCLTIQTLQQGMIPVDLQGRFAFRQSLSCRLHQAPHLRAHVVLTQHQTRRRFGQPAGTANAFHLITENLVDARGQRIVIGCFVIRVRRVTGKVQFASPDILERLAIELVHAGEQPIVDPVVRQHHFDAAFAERFELRRVLRGREVLRADVVDLVLTLDHARHIIFEGGVLSLLIGVAGSKTQQLRHPFPIAEVLRGPLFQYFTKVLPERLVVLRVGFGHLGQQIEHPFGQGVANGRDAFVLLQQFTRHVQRQVVGIDYPFHEAQIHRQKLLGLVQDENPLHVQLQPARRISVP